MRPRLMILFSLKELEEIGMKWDKKKIFQNLFPSLEISLFLSSHTTRNLTFNDKILDDSFRHYKSSIGDELLFLSLKVVFLWRKLTSPILSQKLLFVIEF